MLNGDNSVHLICNEVLAVLKDYNLRWHFDAKHGSKYANISHQEMKGSLRSQKFVKVTQ